MGKDTEELQRWQPNYRNLNLPGMVRVKPGSEINVFVHDDDHKRVAARLQARIEELEAELDRLAEMDEHHAMTAVRQSEMIETADARWRERIEGKAREFDRAADLLTATGDPDGADRRSRAVLLRSLLDSGEEQKCPECGGSRSGLTPFFCGVCKGSGRANPSPALEGREDEGTYRRDPDGCYVCGVDEYAARARGRAESGLPVSQGMVRDGEVIARLHNLDSHRNPHWSDEENRAYSLGVRNAIHVIEHPEEENQSAEAGQPRSVLAREGGNGE